MTLIFSCQQKGKVETNKNPTIVDHRIKSLNEFVSFYDSDLSYDSIKKSVNDHRLRLNGDSISMDSISATFQKALLHRIIPFWEGTEWSFDGHTSIPGKGEIACGYFVSTTLQDVGININRYTLAQQNPKNEALTLAVNSELIIIDEGSTSANIIAIEKRIPEGIHFIGFGNNHVGYLVKLKGHMYLIHSNYMSGSGVEIENIEESQVFQLHDKYYLVELSSSEHFLKSWLARTKFNVVTQ